MTKEAFESWWGSSKYTQVIYHKDSNHQIAKDAWEASEANQQAEMDALKYDLDGYMKIAHASATEIVQQAQTIAELVEALEECLREHGGFTIKGQCERKAREAIAKYKG